jgi:hypothetical protein
MDGPGSGSCPISGFDVSGDEPPGFAAIVLVTETLLNKL